MIRVIGGGSNVVINVAFFLEGSHAQFTSVIKIPSFENMEVHEVNAITHLGWGNLDTGDVTIENIHNILDIFRGTIHDTNDVIYESFEK